MSTLRSRPRQMRTPGDLAATYTELHRSIVRYVMARSEVDRAVAEDAASDALEAVLRRLQAGTPTSAGWARRVAWYEVAKAERAAVRLEQRLKLAATHGGAVISRRGATGRPAQVSPEQWAAVSALCNPREADALALRMAGLSYRQVADRLGVPESTSTSRIASAHRKLRAAARDR
ncbi:MAG: sigma-70 family RNA polymerase sigma factor [Conexibacteraceae bacterium]|nr:sigma-70 family RNA polymerase sigma factor [Conexibacteraceae bacterium]